MKAKKQNMNVRELFRQKLGNAEIIPDASVSAKLMRKLARREFLRFNPARFNMYYLGGILVAGITTVFILSSDSGKSEQLMPLNLSNEIIRTESKENLNVTVEQTVLLKSDKLNEKSSESIKNKPDSRSKVESENEPAQNIESREKNIVNHNGVNDSFSKKGLITEASSEKNKLQGGFRSKEALFETSAKEGCAPLKTRFYNKSNSFDSCRWTFGDGGYSKEKNPDWIFDVEGEFKVVLNVFGPDGLQTASSTVITVYPKPLARFEIAPEKAVLPEDEIHFY
ncbi:MAG: PKD domain-containing protein, partial [Bacteroidia bacterium]|nr:PKD domain-containing protein [Bacteroidia bacterium]